MRESPEIQQLRGLDMIQRMESGYNARFQMVQYGDRTWTGTGKASEDMDVQN